MTPRRRPEDVRAELAAAFAKLWRETVRYEAVMDEARAYLKAQEGAALPPSASWEESGRDVPLEDVRRLTRE